MPHKFEPVSPVSVNSIAWLLTETGDAGSSPTWPDGFFNDIPGQNIAIYVIYIYNSI